MGMMVSIHVCKSKQEKLGLIFSYSSVKTLKEPFH